ncbi:MAG: hypothetical protein D3925_10495, partial [Candidatus Electrothrix sp. AR5]|nr:hypothetical protein [Candidatus Electrothrix sp. AR5]
DFSIKVEQEQIFLSLADNGKGFHVQEILACPQSRRGIGLTAMSERVKMLGGTFDIQSIINQGTTVSFTIPFDFDRKEKE